MEAILTTLGKASTILHIIAGTITLLAGPIAIYANLKNIQLHRVAGLAFFWAMNVVCISGIIGYFKHSDKTFYVFLLGISVFVYGGVLRGVRAIQIMKGGRVLRFDFVYSTIMAAFGVWMVGMGVYHFVSGSHAALPTLFLVFGGAMLNDTYDNFKHFLNPQNYTPTEWLHWHVSTMLGAFTASTTAFTVNSAPFLPWYLQWFGPTILLLPFQIYWGRHFRKQQERRAQLT